MKRLKLFFACLLMAVLSIGQVWGAAISVTTNPTTSGTFTITAAKASGQNAPIEASGCVRLYANNTLTISTSGSANITAMTIAWTKNGSKAFATVTTETGSYTHPSAAGNGTWSGSAKEIVFNVGSSGQIQITSVDITVEEGGKTLSSIAVGGNPTTDTYDEGDAFDPAGLTVTGTYSDASQETISSGITWTACKTENGTYVALDDASVALAKEETGIYVKATANEITSAAFHVTGLTVNEHTVTPGTYDIIFANAFWGTSGTGANAGHTASGKQNDISVSINGNSGTQNYINDNQTRIYGSHTLTFSVPSGYVLKEITGLGTTSNSNISIASGSTGSITTRVWTGSANSVTFDIEGRTDFTTVSVTFALASSSPEVSVSPELWDFGTVHAGDAASKVFSVSGSNLTAGDLTLTAPAGFSVSPSSIAVDGTLEATEVTVSKNTSTVNDYSGNLEITGGGLASAKTVALTMSVDADPAPTGTFKKFTGDLTAGKYVICDGTNAMKNTATSAPRIEAATVTVNAEDKIVNPDANVVWNVEFLTGDDAAYFTLYNEDASKYAAFTSTNARGTVVDAVTDYAKWQYSEKEFSNKGLSGKYLRFNDGFGFASYATTTGNELTLYKLDDGTPNPPTFSPAGGSFLEAQSVTISAETGATIYYTTDGTAPTTSSSVYSAAIPVSTTTTIKAIAVKDEKSSSVASATYTITTIKSVDEIWDEITASGPEDAYVWGYVSQTNVSGYANNFYISVNGSTEGNQLYAYRMNMNSFSVAIGDKVTLNGDLTINGTTKQFKYTNADNCGKVIALVAKGELQSIAISGSATKTEYAANETFEYGGLKVMGTYANGFVGEITEGITWNDDLTDHKVTENTTVHVTATVGDKTSPACNVAVTVAAKTLVSISATPASSTIYTGEVLPEPTITATYSEGPTADVSAEASYDTENAFDTETLGDQTITVSYTFGGVTKTTTYTVTVIDYANDVDHPYTPEEALYITINAVGSTKATKDIYVQGIVSRANAVTGTNKRQRYWISIDGETTSTEFEVYNGKYLAGADFSTSNQLVAGDEVIVKGKVIYYNSTTPEFATGESQLESLARTPNFSITDVAQFEVGATDLAVTDLTYNADGEGAVTFASSDNTDAVTIVDGKLHAVAAGTATITANLAADGIYKAATATFDVTVIAATTKYAISFDGNGADGGSAPVIADKAAGVSVDLPANSFTYAGHLFAGWKVFNDDTSEEIEVNAGAFEMPASTVTIQAQWAEISVWATTYTSNVTLSYTGTGEANSQVKINDEDYAAQKVGSSGNDGSVVVTVPYGTHTLHFHAVAWNGKSVTIAASGVENMSESSFTLAADPGFKSSGTYTLENDPVGQYFVMTFTAVTEETQITFSKTDGDDKRFMLYGVNQEGGVLPVLDHIVVTGDASNKTYDAGDRFDKHEYAGLGANAIYTLADVEQEPVAIPFADIEWSSDPEVVSALTTSVTVTASYGGKHASKEITGLIVNVPDPEIEVSASSLAFGKVAKGASVTDKTLDITLKSVENATLAISGAGASAFSLDEYALTATGTVTVSASSANVGTFEATLTISDDANQAEAQEVALSITVEATDDLSGTWNLVTDEADLMPGMQVIIANIAEGNAVTTLGKQAGANEDGNNRVGVTGNLVSGTVLTPAAGTKVFTLVDAGNGKLAFQGMNGKYLYAASSSANQLKQQATNNANGEWTISIDDDAKATITAQGSNSRNLMRFNPNSGNPIFACYATNSTTGTLVTIYAKAFDYDRELNGNYGTICLPKAGNMVGASIYEVAYYDNSLKKIFFDEVLNGEMEAGMPYIFLPNEGASKLGVYYSDNAAADAPAGNYHGLWGSYSNVELAQNGENYILYNNQYWLVNSEAYVGAYRAYLKMNGTGDDYVPTQGTSAPAPGRRRIAMGVNSEQVVTGVDQITNDQSPITNKVIIDGRLFILRGEKMYDATGRLVK